VPRLTTVVQLTYLQLRHLCVCDVFVRGKEQHYFSLLILDGDDVQQTPERRSCNTNKSTEKLQLTLSTPRTTLRHTICSQPYGRKSPVRVYLNFPLAYPSSTVEAKYAMTYTSIPPYVSMKWCVMRHRIIWLKIRRSVRISAATPAILIFSWNVSVPPDKCKDSTKNRPRPLPSISFLNHSSAILPSDTI
jgi:hypothetical protein